MVGGRSSSGDQAAFGLGQAEGVAGPGLALDGDHVHVARDGLAQRLSGEQQALPLPLAAEVVLFGVLALTAVFAAKRWFRDNPIVSDDPMLNDRGARMVGEVVTVVEAIDGGEGRVKVGDGVWTARGEDAPIGTRVRITGVAGSVVTVEAV